MIAVDITGQRFGKLTAIEVVETGKQRLWRCSCDCGSEVLAPANALRAGQKKTCSRECAQFTTAWDGKRFGRLVVIGCKKNPKKRGLHLECRCDCGNIVLKRAYELRRGVKLGCGCGKKIPHYGGRKPDQDVALNREYNDYRDNARRRKIEWLLTKEEVYRMFLSPCHYCGVPPSRKVSSAMYRRNRVGQTIYVNGIDRYNNGIGYIPSNAVPCCQVCNMRKKAVDGDEFLSWIKRISDHQASKM